VLVQLEKAAFSAALPCGGSRNGIAMQQRQFCHSHLLREFVAFSERDGAASKIGRELLKCTSLVFGYWHGFKDGLLTRQELQSWLRPVQHEIERLLERGEQSDIERVSGAAPTSWCIATPCGPSRHTTASSPRTIMQNGNSETS
jgi:hypothetical protein